MSNSVGKFTGTTVKLPSRNVFRNLEHWSSVFEISQDMLSFVSRYVSGIEFFSIAYSTGTAKVHYLSATVVLCSGKYRQKLVNYTRRQSTESSTRLSMRTI
jgi:hypothetical protein